MKNEPDAPGMAERRALIASPAWLNGVAAALWLFAPTLFRGEPFPGWRFDLRRTNEYLGVPFGLLSVLLALVVHRIHSRLLAWAAATSWLLTTLVYVVPWHGLSGHRDYSAIELAASLYALSLGSTAIVLGTVAVRSLQGRDGWRAARAPRMLHGITFLSLAGFLAYQAVVGARGILLTGPGGLGAVYSALELHRAVGFAMATTLAVALLAHNVRSVPRRAHSHDA